MEKIKLPKVDPKKVRRLNEGVDDNSGDKYIIMITVFGIAILIALSIVL